MNDTIPEFTTSSVDAGFAPEDEHTKDLYREVAAFARHGQPVVIFGPTGAGKEFLARHYYNTLIKSEFYNQNKEKWPERFREIRKQYSAFYSGKSLDIFLGSIKAGVFETINSATIYPYLAESILFGHEEGSFTGAVMANPGLLESIKYGVLFMDEIGELPKALQSKLLRAIDPETVEGRRLAGKMDYSLRDIIIITATNKPPGEFRKDFYYRIGREVNMKGIDERPKDVTKSIPYFISRAIGKRKDYAAVINMFGIRGLRDINKLPDTEEVTRFAREMGDMITDEILARKWPGNFRTLRNALESSIFRIENTYDINDFAREFSDYLHHYIAQYSTAAFKTSMVEEEYVHGTIFPSSNPEMDRNILDEIDNTNILKDMDYYEKKALSVFLSSTHEKGFRRKDLEDYYKKHDNIGHTSASHIRGRINRLLNLNMLARAGKGKSTRYYLRRSFLEKVSVKNEDVFAVPCTHNYWTDRSNEINILGKVLQTTERVYIQAPSGYGKSSFVAMFCKARKEKYNFYYYPLGEEGITKMFKDIIKLLRSENVEMDSTKILEDPVNNIHPFLEKFFRAGEGVKPVLILDHAHYVSDPGGIGTIVKLARKWKEIILILTGDTMDNAFQEDFYEFVLRPWGREA